MIVLCHFIGVIPILSHLFVRPTGPRAPCPVRRETCVYVCSIVGSQMMLRTAMDPKRVSSLLQTIKPSSGLSPLPEKQALLRRHAQTCSRAHTNRRVNIHCNHRSEVQIPLNLTGEAGDLYHSNTACPFPSVTLQLFSSLISSTCCAPYQAPSSPFLP